MREIIIDSQKHHSFLHKEFVFGNFINSTFCMIIKINYFRLIYVNLDGIVMVHVG